MVLPKNEGGLSLHNPRYMKKAMMVHRTVRLWSLDSIWPIWMQSRYVQGRELCNIEQQARDSSIWSNILHGREHIELCLHCNVNLMFHLTSANFIPSFTNIYDLYRLFNPPIPLPKVCGAASHQKWLLLFGNLGGTNWLHSFDLSAGERPTQIIVYFVTRWRN